MDSFAEPRKSVDPQSFATVQEQVLKLEQDHRARGIQLSGRIIHVCHYLPVTAALASSKSKANGTTLPSPPATPPAKSADIPSSPTAEEPSQTEGLPEGENAAAVREEPKAKWAFATRYGHSAMNSGIHSLASTHEQIIIGWTGDVEAASSPTDATETGTATAVPPPSPADQSSTKILSSSLGEAERKAYEAQLQDYLGRGEHEESTAGRGKGTRYVPVWLEDKMAHGHYEGYCKQSECFALQSFLNISLSLVARRAAHPVVPSLPSFCVVLSRFARSPLSSAIFFSLLE